MHQVLKDIDRGQFVRTQVKGKEGEGLQKDKIMQMKVGKLI